MKTVKINNREFNVSKIDYNYLEMLADKGYHISDWVYFNARYSVTDVKTGKEWFTPYNYKQFMTEIMNNDPKCFM